MLSGLISRRTVAVRSFGPGWSWAVSSTSSSLAEARTFCCDRTPHTSNHARVSYRAPTERSKRRSSPLARGFINRHVRVPLGAATRCTSVVVNGLTPPPRGDGLQEYNKLFNVIWGAFVPSVPVIYARSPRPSSIASMPGTWPCPHPSCKKVCRSPRGLTQHFNAKHNHHEKFGKRDRPLRRVRHPLLDGHLRILSHTSSQY